MSVFDLKTPPQTAKLVSTADVRKAFAVFADPTAGCFVQGLPWAHWETIAGNDPDALVAAAVRVAGAAGTYFGLNPCPVGEKLTNENATNRRWVLFDFDVTDAHTEKRNATDAEREVVHETAANAADYLMGRGWSPPVMVDSGNGTHLLYRVEMANDASTSRVVKTVLSHVAGLFDTAAVHLGIECYDARRITKLPGTFANRGGRGAAGGRMAGLVNVPDPVEVVPAELIAALASEEAATRRGMTAPPPAPSIPPPDRGSVFLLNQCGNLRAYAQAALRAEAARVRMAPAGGRNTTLNDAAFRCGTLVGAGWIYAQEVEAELTLAAFACGLMDDPDDGTTKTDDTIRRAIRDGAKHPRQAPPERNGKHESGRRTDTADNQIGVVWRGEVVVQNTPAYFTAQAAATDHRRGPRLYEMLTLDELILRELPEPNWAIPGLLSEGLNLLVGSPKMGKSMLALNLALTVAGGGKALDDIQTIAGDVMYLSLEDKLRRVRTRAVKMMMQYKIDGTAKRLAIVTEWPRMHQGGLILIKEWVQRVERPTLLIIDVLGRFRPPSKERGNQYEQDSEHLYAIKQFVDDNSITGLVNHHTRKARSESKDDDEFEEISGTQGIGGACDGIMMLRRSRNSNDAQISLTGRDFTERKLAIQFDPETLTWKSCGNAEDFLGGKKMKAIVAYLKATPGRPVFLSELSGAIEEPNTHRVRGLLLKLRDKGIVRQHNNAWVYPGPNEANDEQAF